MRRILQAVISGACPLYRMAHVSIHVDTLTPEQVAETIARAAKAVVSN